MDAGSIPAYSTRRKMDEEEVSKMINYLMEKGAVEIYGMTDFGEITYKFNLKVVEEVLPELYNMIMSEVDNDLLELYELGYVDISYDEELNASFSVNEEGRKYLRESGMTWEDI